MYTPSSRPSLENLPDAFLHLLRRIDHAIELIGAIGKSPPEEPDRWFSLQELRDYLPGKPTKKSIYRWVSEASIPYQKQENGRLVFRKSQIDAWLLSPSSTTTADINNEVDSLLSQIKRRKKRTRVQANNSPLKTEKP
ncbi:MAG: helix-turn-helix transcriptional regulator [Bacteroidia bacterium]